MLPKISVGRTSFLEIFQNHGILSISDKVTGQLGPGNNVGQMLEFLTQPASDLRRPEMPREAYQKIGGRLRAHVWPALVLVSKQNQQHIRYREYMQKTETLQQRCTIRSPALFPGEAA
jgi:hypothetical protein